MSPEQLRAEELTPRSDVFSLGAVLAHAATGHDPFGAPSMPAIIYRILNEPPNLGPLAGPLRDVIAACLAKDPDARPTPGDIIAFCNQAGDGRRPALPTHPVPVGTRTARLTSPAPPAQGSHRRVNGRKPPRGRRGALRWLAILGTAVVVVAAGLTAFAESSLGRTPTGHATSPPPSASALSSVTATRAGTLPGPAGANVYSTVFAPDGVTLAVADSNGTTYLWNSSTKTRIASFPDTNSGGVYRVAFSPDGRTMATVDFNGSIYLWNVPGKTLITVIPNPGSKLVGSAVFGPGGILAIANYDGNVYFWNLAQRKVTGMITDPGTEGVGAAGFGPGGELATADFNGNAYLWNLAKKKPFVTTTITDPGTQGGVGGVSFGPGGELATADHSGITYVWNSAKQLIATLTDPTTAGHVNNVYSAAFGPDGIVATTDQTGKVYLWNPATQKVIGSISMAPSPQFAIPLSFGKDDAVLATADGGSTTYLWRVIPRTS
jgi:hypothetical protein